MIVTGLVFLIAYQLLHFPSVDLRFSHIKNEGTRITIEVPKFIGYGRDGHPYVLRANFGTQDMSRSDFIELEGVDLRLDIGSDGFVQLTAGSGNYNAKNDRAEFKNGVLAYNENNDQLQTEYAIMDFKANTLASDRHTVLKLRSAEISADSVELLASERRATLSGNVHSVLHGRDWVELPSMAQISPSRR